MTDDPSGAESDRPGATADEAQPTAPDEPHPNAAPDVWNVKIGPDGNPVKRSIPPEHWEAIGREALADLLRDHRRTVTHEIDEAVGAIEYGTPVYEDHVRHLRDAIEILEVSVETRLVPLVDDAEPWERTADRVPYGRMYATLGFEQADVRRLQELRQEREGDADAEG